MRRRRILHSKALIMKKKKVKLYKLIIKNKMT